MVFFIRKSFSHHLVKDIAKEINGVYFWYLRKLALLPIIEFLMITEFLFSKRENKRQLRTPSGIIPFLILPGWSMEWKARGPPLQAIEARGHDARLHGWAGPECKDPGAGKKGFCQKQCGTLRVFVGFLEMKESNIKGVKFLVTKPSLDVSESISSLFSSCMLSRCPQWRGRRRLLKCTWNYYWYTLTTLPWKGKCR